MYPTGNKHSNWDTAQPGVLFKSTLIWVLKDFILLPKRIILLQKS